MVVGGLDGEAAVERDLARAQGEALELADGLGQQLALVGGADLAGGGQDQPARAAAGVGRQLGELDHVAELVALAELALADRARECGAAAWMMPPGSLGVPCLVCLRDDR
jgi:hypothetical protein